MQGIYILEDKTKSIQKDGQDYIFCKIGMSNIDINKRIKQVKSIYKFSGNKTNLQEYVVMESINTRCLEKWYHQMLSSYRITNEFFLVPLDKLNQVIMTLQLENIKLK